jgi:hypothetical protein
LLLFAASFPLRLKSSGREGFVTVRTAAMIITTAKRTVQNEHAGLTTLADARLVAASRPSSSVINLRNARARRESFD